MRNQRVYKSIDAWRNQLIVEAVLEEGGEEVSNVSVVVAIGVTKSGYRKILG